MPAQEYLAAHNLAWKRSHPLHRSTFGPILCREHCRRRGGADSAAAGTVKPLAQHGFDPSRTILVDDSANKVLREEMGSCIILPTLCHPTVRLLPRAVLCAPQPLPWKPR
jgi:NLI interacting factor-like phosphatase